jgi:arylsulfatase A-like enzyme
VKPNKPNIVMILLDDMGFWTLGGSGNTEIQTPSIDDLASRGLAFENCYCASPVCSPARGSLLTGRIPSQHGVVDWIRKGSVDSGDDRAVEYLSGMKAFTDVLNENGYHCGLVGKWHLGDSYTPQKGFQHWVTTPKGSDNYYGAKLFRDGQEEIIERYLTDELTEEAIGFIDQRSKLGDPFYLSLNFTAPHRPWSKDQHPARFWELYEGCNFETCPDLPRHPWQINNGMYPHEDRMEMVRGYSTALTAADAAIGKVYSKLEQLGLAENTLVIITSDNGMSLGHHGIHGKGNATYPQNMYEQAVKVPFILIQPGTIAPSSSDALISHYDFCPSLLDYLGIDESVGENLPGRSFLPHILGQDDPGRDEVVIFDEYGPVRMLRDSRWKFVLRMGEWPNELYDLVADPGEENNLIDRADHAEVAARLEQKLVDWFAKFVEPTRDASKHNVVGRGQLDLLEKNDPQGTAMADDWFYQSTGKADVGPNL